MKLSSRKIKQKNKYVISVYVLFTFSLTILTWPKNPKNIYCFLNTIYNFEMNAKEEKKRNFLKKKKEKKKGKGKKERFKGKVYLKEK